jgi:hypothetical protein
MPAVRHRALLATFAVGVALAASSCGRLRPERGSPLNAVPFPCEAPAGGLDGWEGVTRPEVSFLVPKNMLKGWPANRYDIVYGMPGRAIGVELTRQFSPVNPPRNVPYTECTELLGGRRVEVLAFQDITSTTRRFAIDARWRDVYDGRDLVVRVEARDLRTFDELRRVLFTVVFPDTSQW